MKPTYIPQWLDNPEDVFNRLETEVDWLSLTETREEYFMSETPVSYTYGKGRGIRTYTSAPYAAGVDAIQEKLNTFLTTTQDHSSTLNVCFLNKYNNQLMHLGWHADDHEGTDHTQPIAVISFGAEREIWWRPNGFAGVIPPENRQLLGNGSLFVMPPGFQSYFQHRIPKGDRAMNTRISLTFRAFIPSHG